ncbi:hypothetical protein DPMN_116274 [Dreissena polymorpha]|uniref:Uncharacterized protein n=1 Tax=Dreissena polymorpha TaxID=45954 RepID=A0A9D4KNF5_DREPO|nr:hypothetical protein DPMN_116274 [Dreissena polymorpha]
MAPDTKVPDGRADGRTAGRTDNTKTISLRLWRGIITSQSKIDSGGIYPHGSKIIYNAETAASPGGHVFQQTEPILELSRDIIGTNNLTTFHEDWTLNVTSRMLTRKTAPPTGRHVFQRSRTIFELS